MNMKKGHSTFKNQEGESLSSESLSDSSENEEEAKVQSNIIQIPSFTNIQ